MWEKELKICKRAAVEAGLAIMEIYEKADDIEIEKKGDGSPLTNADKASHRIIAEYLTKNFPEYALLSEEGVDDKERLSNPMCFVVDPLDGTKEFIKRNGQFTVNIALAREHRSIMGVIYVPVTGELYYAAEGLGSFLERIDIEKEKQQPESRAGESYELPVIGEPEKLRVSDQTKVTELRAVGSSSHASPAMQELLDRHHITKMVQMGSSLKGCLIAKGDADIYFRHNPTMEWDTAAMQCIAEQAGAIFRQMDDSEMLYNREDSLNAKGFYVINRIENRLR
ncbi:MAG: 3'(2'),5'-bisphosphate nucleotidase CysQ [Lachnospiraceae bacterium]|nr:3'(2'),5'-bisphosphate nucleotidase CysQ [Lachnospiraceae bacterium]